MHDDTIEAFGFPAVGRKKLAAAFDGGRITSDGGVMLLAAAERRMGLAQRLAGVIADPRNPLFITHSVVDILRARMLAIACRTLQITPEPRTDHAPYIKSWLKVLRGDKRAVFAAATQAQKIVDWMWERQKNG